MRAIWKGSISFGLVNIPIALFPATRREELTFRLLRAGDLSPVNYKRVAEADGKEVPWENIVKGYEHEKGQFVVLKEEDFKRVDVEATQTVEIVNFVSLDEINPMYFSKPYYMEPAKAGVKAYVLLREALRARGQVGIARVVIRTREHLAAVKPNDKALVLELMHFADELIAPDELRLPDKATISKGEMDMAKTLIERMTEKWDPEKYQDEYKAALMEMIEKKIEAGDKGAKTPARRSKPKANIIDLADVLRKSLGEAQGKSGAAKKKTKAPLRRKAA
jgi:DNA end-binding protein Ku